MPRLALLALALFAFPLLAAPVPKGMKKPPAVDDEVFGFWANSPGGTSGWLFNSDGTGGCGDRNNPSCQAVIRVDATQTPKHLDWSQDGGKSWYLGVYEIDGDTLKLNFGGGSTGVRPTAIGPNTGAQWVTGTRMK